MLLVFSPAPTVVVLRVVWVVVSLAAPFVGAGSREGSGRAPARVVFFQEFSVFPRVPFQNTTD
jgi:hypothetical protein